MSNQDQEREEKKLLQSPTHSDGDKNKYGSFEDDCYFDTKTQTAIAKTEKARKKLLFASVFCVIFMMGEIAGGYIAHSIALMSDALHLLSDCGGLLISVIALVCDIHFNLIMFLIFCF